LSQNKVIIFTRYLVKKVFNIPSGKRTTKLFKIHEQCDLRNIYQKNARAPIAYIVDVIHNARNDDGHTTRRSWVLLVVALVLTQCIGNMVPLEYLKILEEMDKTLNYSLPRACFMHESDFDLVLDFDKNNVALGKASFEKCHTYFRPYKAILCAQGTVTRVAVGNISGAAQDEHVSKSLDCDDTQICGAEDVNINENQDDVGAEHNPIEDSNPMENVKSTEEHVCGSLDEWFQNSVPFVVELELLKNVHVALSSTQEATYVTFDVLPPCSSDIDKQSSRRKAADEPTTDEVVVEVAAGALSNRASSRAHQPNRGNVVELHARTSASVNEANADYYENEKKQVSCGEDVEHGPQLSHLNHCVTTSVARDWSDVPSKSLFQDGTKEYNYHGNTTATPKSCVVFDTTPQAPSSTRIKVLVFDVKPIAIAPFSSGTIDGPQRPQEEPLILDSSREPSTNRDKEKLRSKDEKKRKSKKRVGIPMSIGPKYKKIKTDRRWKQCTQVFDPIICAKELRRLFFNIVRDGNWIVCVANLLHKEFTLIDSLDIFLDIAARNLEKPHFTMDLSSLKLHWPLLDYPQQSTQHINIFSISFLFTLKNNFYCGYFGVLYFDNFDSKRTQDFKKQNMLDVWKYLSLKLFYHPLDKVCPDDVLKAFVAA
ncbi:hypothetical protein ZWY2020_048744, partial [Hordeum vulgare]